MLEILASLITFLGYLVLFLFLSALVFGAVFLLSSFVNDKLEVSICPIVSLFVAVMLILLIVPSFITSLYGIDISSRKELEIQNIEDNYVTVTGERDEPETYEITRHTIYTIMAQDREEGKGKDTAVIQITKTYLPLGNSEKIEVGSKTEVLSLNLRTSKWDEKIIR